jgi:hypothetical protein
LKFSTTKKENQRVQWIQQNQHGFLERKHSTCMISKNFRSAVYAQSGIMLLQSLKRNNWRFFLVNGELVTLTIIHTSAMHTNKKAPEEPKLFCGPDGTRTRDLRRDRAAF